MQKFLEISNNTNRPKVLLILEHNGDVLRYGGDLLCGVDEMKFDNRMDDDENKNVRILNNNKKIWLMKKSKEMRLDINDKR